ncbi:hypothetical protein BDZ97DRAFT_205531 [Flammula alnicola]|nr:hypothetical protein BDZ97DRAFT_205531 [Flammula alnicola]
MSRWVVVDDADSGIFYNGAWFADRGTLDNLGNFGAPYLSTLHGTNSTASLTYAFTGTRVLITGTNQFVNPTGVSWQCSVDNQIFPSVPNSVPVNNLLLCEKDGLADGPHVITVNATVSNQETFWFDYVKYLPSPSVSLAQAAISIDSTDSGLQFDPGWKQFSPGFETTQTSSKLSFNFTGVSLIYYGFYDPSLPFDASSHTATYAIDGQTPIPFDAIINASSLTTKPTGVRYNQVLFETAKLPAGPHTLEVEYLGTNATTPLTFEFLVVQNGTSASSPAPVSSSTLPGPVASSSGVLPFTPTSFTTLTLSGTSSSTSLAPGVTPTSAASTAYQSNNTSMLALASLAVFFLCRRNARSNRY